MTEQTEDSARPGYLEVTQGAGRMLVQRHIIGPVVMLNLLRFRAQADYSAAPELVPSTPISGEEAFARYIAETLPLLRASGGDILFLGRGGPFLIGPDDERWDAVMLIRQNSVADFIDFASNPAYLPFLRHRTAALEDSRLLPVLQYEIPQGVERGPD